MKALQFINNNLSLAEVVRPNVANEALVRVTMSGICNTDLEIVRGYAGFNGTIGHEFVGVVEESDDKNWIGKRVVGEINVGCGVCELCKIGDSRHCPTRTVLGIHGRDGCHAEFLTLPTRNLLEVPENVSDESATFTEPLAAAFGITEQVVINQNTRVAVIGDGKLGILCASALALKSNNVVLIGKHKDKLSKAKNVEGILLADAEKLSQFDVVVEASGSETGFATALNLTKPRGKLVLKSTFNGKTAMEMWRVVVDEISIVGSRCGRFAPALEILQSKQIDVESLISEAFSLTKGVEAIEKATTKGIMKILLKP
ncbi:MAG: alcohol dehydrogenase catalytic domain-containing protein [Pyrinomonadaceae bacterium]|nr:alcohol dehydrogenase catalytic domain-containing protein [Pyrinomonadaceae bacterium]